MTTNDNRDRDLDALDAIAHEIATQDNAITADPIFVVMQTGHRFGVREWVQPFLTRRAAEDYIASNAHNLRKPSVYVASASRNYEWQLMRRVPAMADELRALLADRSIRDAEHDGRRLAASKGECAALEAEVQALRKQKDNAYAERDRLVCALSKLFPAHLARHPDSDKEWDDDWRWIVYVHLPTGQVSWHIHDSELPWFEHLPKGENVWDGHDTAEKYRRLEALRDEEPADA